MSHPFNLLCLYTWDSSYVSCVRWYPRAHGITYVLGACWRSLVASCYFFSLRVKLRTENGSKCYRCFHVLGLHHGLWIGLLFTSNWELSTLFSCSGHALRCHRSGEGFHGSSSDGFSPVMLPYSEGRNWLVLSAPYYYRPPYSIVWV
jgi:hypothetical protein